MKLGKKALSLLSVLALLASLLSVVPVATVGAEVTNLVNNGGFEDGLTDWSSDRIGNWGSETGYYNSGSKSVYGTNASYYPLYQELTVDPSKTYVVTAYIKSQAASKFGISVLEGAGDHVYDTPGLGGAYAYYVGQKELTGTSADYDSKLGTEFNVLGSHFNTGLFTWEKVTFIIEPTQSAVVLALTSCSNTGVYTWFDDISVTEYVEPVVEVVNGGFEDGLNGWSTERSANWVSEVNPVHSGSKSVYGTGGSYYPLYQALTVNPDKTYEVTAYIKSQYNSKFGISVLEGAGDHVNDVSSLGGAYPYYVAQKELTGTSADYDSKLGNEFNVLGSHFHTGTYDWEKVTFTIEPTQRTIVLALTSCAGTSIYTWFDDISIVEQTTVALTGSITKDEVTINSASITWPAATGTAAAENITYSVYMSESAITLDNIGSATLVTTVNGAGELKATATGLKTNTNYYFAVQAADTSPSESAETVTIFSDAISTESYPTEVVNGGFEDGLNGWSTERSANWVSEVNPVHSGSKSVYGTGGSYYPLYQALTVDPSKTYEVTAYIKSQYNSKFGVAVLEGAGDHIDDVSSLGAAYPYYVAQKELTGTSADYDSKHGTEFNVLGSHYHTGTYNWEKVTFTIEPNQSTIVLALTSCAGTSIYTWFDDISVVEKIDTTVALSGSITKGDVTTDSVTITWPAATGTAAAENITYSVYMSESAITLDNIGSATLVTTVNGANELKATATGLKSNTDYYFAVQAADTTPTETAQAVTIFSEAISTMSYPTEIVNGGFEDGLTGWSTAKPDNWKVESPSGYAHSGTQSVLGTNASYYSLYQPMTVEPGKTYQVTAYVKSQAASKFGVAVLEGLGDNVDNVKLLGETKAYYVWQKKIAGSSTDYDNEIGTEFNVLGCQNYSGAYNGLEISFTIEPTQSTIVLALGAYCGSYVYAWFDDISVVDTTIELTGPITKGEVTIDSATITWPAATGTAVAGNITYSVYMSESAITLDNIGSATLVTTVNGANELKATATGLKANTDYYFAVQAADTTPTESAETVTIFSEVIHTEAIQFVGIVNGGFEDGLNGWSSDRSANWVSEVNPVHSGSKSVYGTGGSYYPLYQSLTVDPDKTYVVTAYIKSQYNSKFGVAVLEGAGDHIKDVSGLGGAYAYYVGQKELTGTSADYDSKLGKEFNVLGSHFHTGTYDWEKVTFTIEPTQNTIVLALTSCAGTSIYTWFDDISIVEKVDTTVALSGSVTKGEVTIDSVSITWPAATGTAAAEDITYSVYMSKNAITLDNIGSATLITTVTGADELKATITGLQASTDYYFAVQATDTTPTESAETVTIFSEAIRTEDIQFVGVVNGGFENGLDGWATAKPDNWKVESPSGYAHGGTQSVVGTNSSYYSLYQALTVEPGKTYQVTAYVKSQAAAKFGVAVLEGLGNNVHNVQLLGETKAYYVWQKNIAGASTDYDNEIGTEFNVLGCQNYAGAHTDLRVTFTIEPTQNTIVLALGAYCGSYVYAWFDDISVVEKIEYSKEVVNGGFENGLDGWSTAKPDNWKVETPSAYAHSGTQSVLGTNASYYSLYQPLTVDPGKTYVVTAYVKSQAASKFGVAVLEGEGANVYDAKLLGETKAYYVWQKNIAGASTDYDNEIGKQFNVLGCQHYAGAYTGMKVTFTIKPTQSAVVLALGAYCGSYVYTWFDDITVVEKDDTSVKLTGSINKDTIATDSVSITWPAAVGSTPAANITYSVYVSNNAITLNNIGTLNPFATVNGANELKAIATGLQAGTKYYFAVQAADATPYNEAAEEVTIFSAAIRTKYVATELLQNGGFENVQISTEDSTITGAGFAVEPVTDAPWVMVSAETSGLRLNNFGDARRKITSADKHSGNYALSFRFNATDRYAAYQEFNVQKGYKYTLSFWYKGMAGARAALATNWNQWTTGKYAASVTIEETSVWTKYTIEYYPSAGGTMRVWLTGPDMEDGSECIFDDVSVTEEYAPLYFAASDVLENNITKNSINISWATPILQGDASAVTAYKVYMSNQAITPNNIASLTPVSTVTTQIYGFSGLQANTGYYFAVEATNGTDSTILYDMQPTFTQKDQTTSAPGTNLIIDGGFDESKKFSDNPRDGWYRVNGVGELWLRWGSVYDDVGSADKMGSALVNPWQEQLVQLVQVEPNTTYAYSFSVENYLSDGGPAFRVYERANGKWNGNTLHEHKVTTTSTITTTYQGTFTTGPNTTEVYINPHNAYATTGSNGQCFFDEIYLVKVEDPSLYMVGSMTLVERSKEHIIVNWPKAQADEDASNLTYTVYASDELITAANIGSLSPYTTVTGGATYSEVELSGLTPGDKRYFAVSVTNSLGETAWLYSETAFATMSESDDHVAAVGTQLHSSGEALRFRFTLDVNGVTMDDDTHIRDLSNATMVINGVVRKITDFGVMLHVKEDPAPAVLSVDTTDKSSDKIPAEKLISIDGDTVTFVARLNIPSSMTGRNVSARAYIEYEVDGETKYLYSIRIVDSINGVLTKLDELDAEFSGTTYYVSSSTGSDTNNGKSEDKPFKTLSRVKWLYGSNVRILFKRGDIWRGEELTLRTGVTYGAYGTGENPMFYGSAQNYSVASNWKQSTSDERIWYYDESFSMDIGGIVFNDGEDYAVRRFALSDLNSQNEYYFGDDGKVYLFSRSGNPADTYGSIEFLPDVWIIKGQSISNVTVQNITVKYAGRAAVQVDDSITNSRIENCEFSWIGGVLWGSQYGTVRLGNAINIWGNCQNMVVTNCDFYQIYDTAFTPQYDSQSSGTEITYENIEFSNNTVDKCHYGIELWISSAEHDVGTINGINIYNNVMRNAGGGWSANQRGTAAALSMASHFETMGHTCPNISDVTFDWNMFDRSAGTLVGLRWDEYTPVLKNNTFIQESGDAFGYVGGPAKYTFDDSIKGKIPDNTAKVEFAD